MRICVERENNRKMIEKISSANLADGEKHSRESHISPSQNQMAGEKRSPPSLNLNGSAPTEAVESAIIQDRVSIMPNDRDYYSVCRGCREGEKNSTSATEKEEK